MMASLKFGEYLDDILQKVDPNTGQYVINPIQPQKLTANYDDMCYNSINGLTRLKKLRLRRCSTEYNFHTNFPIKGGLKYFEMKRQFPSVVHISDYAYDVCGRRLHDYKALYIKRNWLYCSPTDFSYKVYGKKSAVFKFDTCLDREKWILIKRKRRHEKLVRRYHENTKSNWSQRHSKSDQ